MFCIFHVVRRYQFSSRQRIVFFRLFFAFRFRAASFASGKNKSKWQHHKTPNNNTMTFWFAPFSDLIKKKVCRYLLHRYLGSYIDEKISLDQLNVDFYNGTGTISDIVLSPQVCVQILLHLFIFIFLYFVCIVWWVSECIICAYTRNDQRSAPWKHITFIIITMAHSYTSCLLARTKIRHSLLHA